MFFPQTTIKRGEREGEVKNRMEKKRQTDKRKKDGGRGEEEGKRERTRDKRNSRNIYTWGDLF